MQEITSLHLCTLQPGKLTVTLQNTNKLLSIKISCIILEITKDKGQKRQKWEVLLLKIYTKERISELALAYLVVIILWRTSVVKSKIQTAGSWDMDSFFKFIVIPDRMNCFYSLPSSPGSWDLQTCQKTRFFFLFQHSEIRVNNESYNSAHRFLLYIES